MRAWPLLALLLCGAAAAQDWPSKPVRLVVPYVAGGLPDTMARMVAPQLGKALGQQVLVENRPGAGGIAGAEAVAKAPADGYTLLVTDVGQLAINPHLYPKLPYDPLRDFAAVSLIGTSVLFLVASASVPAGNFAELVALARARPGELNYGSSGNGSIHHLAMEALKAALDLDIAHVPYKGTGQAVPALLGGQVSLLFSSPPSIAAHIRAGRLKVFAVSTAARSPEAPGVPAIAELGVPGFNFVPEIGVVAPAATPAAIVQQLSGGIARAVRDADNAQRFAQLSIVPAGSAPEVYARMIRSAYDRYGGIVKISGARAE